MIMNCSTMVEKMFIEILPIFSHKCTILTLEGIVRVMAGAMNSI